METEIAVSVAGPEEIGSLIRFFRALEAAEQPQNPQAADQGQAGLQTSLAAHDFLRSESCWLLLARVAGEPAGYLLAVRVPKADDRVGFVFVDELYVLPAHRRQGVAQKLLGRIQSLAREEGLAGIRLLVRPENEPARALYSDCGFDEQPSIFCQWLVEKAGGEKTPGLGP